jgi:hypothetical protein
MGQSSGCFECRVMPRRPIQFLDPTGIMTDERAEAAEQRLHVSAIVDRLCRGGRHAGALPSNPYPPSRKTPHRHRSENIFNGRRCRDDDWAMAPSA